MRLGARWYKGESVRLLPNIECSHISSDSKTFISLVWLKFFIEVEI